MKNMTFAIPSNRATKRLKIKTTGGKRKIAISSNLLRLFNFEFKDLVTETSLGENKGVKIERVEDLFACSAKTKRVYSRQYKSRKNNALETLLEVQSQKLIDSSFPEDCTHVHVEMKMNVIYVRPISEFKAQAILNAKPESKYSVFAACTSGVDVATCFEPLGWSVHSIIECRPSERRDSKLKSDLSETGAITALRNIKNGIKNLFCEDITTIDVGQLERAVLESPATVFMASPACDDFSNVKSNSLKDASIADLSSTLDMALDLIRVIEAIKPPVVVFENVSGWYKSQIYEVLSLRLRKKGYCENLSISDARDRGGLTSRVRGYAVFSCLDAAFHFEEPVRRRTESLWPIVSKHIDNCRDVTHSKSLQDGLKSGRLRLISQDKTFCPTILKSQSRMASDSVVIEHSGRLYWPSEELLKELMGMPDFELDCVSRDIGSEIIGQSVEVPALQSVVRSITKHVDEFFNTKQRSLA